MSAEEEGRQGPGRLLAGVAWAALLLGLWLWGRDVSDGMAARLATTGDIAAVGRPLGRQAPPHAHAPLPASAAVRPTAISIGALGVRAAPLVERGLGADGTPAPPPSTAADRVGWYTGGPRPGEAGAALLAGRAEADTPAGADGRGAVFRALAGIKRGERVDIRRSDGSTVRFAVEDVTIHDRGRFDARRAYAVQEPGRAELRLIGAGGGGHGHGHGRGGARADGADVVVVSAYLTGFQPPGARG
ncbi:sortase domain-containing protein [Streptomyces sp. NPDC002446]